MRTRIVSEEFIKNHGHLVDDSQMHDEAHINFSDKLKDVEFADLFGIRSKLKGLELSELMTAGHPNDITAIHPDSSKIPDAGIPFAASLEETLVDEWERKNGRMRSSPKLRTHSVHFSLKHDYLEIL